MASKQNVSKLVGTTPISSAFWDAIALRSTGVGNSSGLSLSGMWCAGTTTPSLTATTPPTPTPTPAVVLVKIVEASDKYAFSPATLSIKVGTQVVWINTTDAAHTATSDTAGVFGTNNNLTTNQTFMFTFTTPGTFAYHCNVHPYMKATITVMS